MMTVFAVFIFENYTENGSESVKLGIFPDQNFKSRGEGYQRKYIRGRYIYSVIKENKDQSNNKGTICTLLIML